MRKQMSAPSTKSNFIIDLDGRASGGVCFSLQNTEDLTRCCSLAEIDAQADMLKRLIDDVAAKMKIELDRQLVERQV